MRSHINFPKVFINLLYLSLKGNFLTIILEFINTTKKKRGVVKELIGIIGNTRSNSPKILAIEKISTYVGQNLAKKF